MIDFYEEIRLVHIAAVVASGVLFALRGLAFNLGAGWARAAPLRFLSYTIDTVLLTAALMLMTIVQQYPFVDAWLTVKVVLLVVYILLGILALREGQPLELRMFFWFLALLIYLFIVSVARQRAPLGAFTPILGG